MKLDKELSDWKVLVVDDEPDNIEVVQEVLEFHGAEVFIAANGKEALDMIGKITPTLILTDLTMPEMDGWAFLRKIREKTELEKVPVVAVTAHAMTGDAERGKAAGFDGYMTKPLSAFTLIDDIRAELPALSGKQTDKETVGVTASGKKLEPQNGARVPAPATKVPDKASVTVPVMYEKPAAGKNGTEKLVKKSEG